MVQLDHMMNLLAITFTVFSYCYSSEVNITFHNNATTWIGAVKYCASIGAVLFSDEQYLRNQTTYEVWTGKYKALTPWRILWGCYGIDFKNIFPIYGDQPECQKKCIGTDFYALKDTRCVCLQQTDLRNEKSIRSCDCSNCVKVFKHGFVNVLGGKNACTLENESCCMAAACLDYELKLTSEQCSTWYKIICDDHAEGGHTSYENGMNFCYTQNSILRRYTRENLCPTELAQHWTSGLSTSYGYTLQYNDNISNLNPRQCFRVAHRNTNGMEYVQCNKVFPFYCQAGSIVYEYNSSSKGDGQSNDSNNTVDLMVGIVVSIVVILLILVVLLVVLLRRKYSKHQLVLKTAGWEDRYTNEMDNYTIISDYQQLDKVKNRRNKIKPYDQLHVKHPVDSYQTDDHSNTSSSKEEDNKYESIENTNEIDINKVTLEYEVLDKTQQDKITKAYDQLHYTHVVDTNSTNNHSNTIIESEHKISTNTTSFEYEEVNNAKKDKSVNVYDPLNTTNEGNFNSNMSKTMILTEGHINNESIEAATAMGKHTVTLEYEQLDIAGKEEGINVYDQLHVTP